MSGSLIMPVILLVIQVGRADVDVNMMMVMRMMVMTNMMNMMTMNMMNIMMNRVKIIVVTS